MSTFAWLTWAMTGILVVIGFVTHLVLYHKGAFKTGLQERVQRLAPMTLSREITRNETDYYLSVGVNQRPWDSYSLRLLRMFICSAILVSLFFIGLILYAFPH
ncbi:hypothetical protein [Reticulibacter mediterranei]|nr:hypothetical protein [Reticulibacter mediterranei]